MLSSIFGGGEKKVIGMVHFPPLPGSPYYDDKRQGLDFIKQRIEHDLSALQNGGIDAVMFCNENDRPYVFTADYASIAVMSEVIGELKNKIKIPYGIDVLWDPKAAIAVAKATGGSFIREIVSGAYISDMGVWNTSVGEFYRYRRLLEANHITVFFNICAEFASNLDRRPLETIAKSVVFSSMADVILISGPMTGMPPALESIAKVKKEVNVPVFINTGLSVDTVDTLLETADGAIVGTYLKRDGITWNEVDEERVEALMKKVKSLRG